MKIRLDMRALFFLFTLSMILSCSSSEEKADEDHQASDTSTVSTGIDESEVTRGPLELSNDQFYVAWGAENYSGPSDLSVEASLWSDAEAINLIVQVKDDEVSLSDDLLHSDHVEVWLSASSAPMKYIVVTDTSNGAARLFHYKNTTNVDSFLVELEHPLFNYSSPSEDEEESFRGRVDTTERARMFWQEYGFQYRIDQLKKGTIEEDYVFDGMVHWGLFPREREAFLYDEERYEVIESHTGTTLAIAEHPPNYTVETSRDGYVIRAQFTPESLGFVSSWGIGKVDFMIDVVDVDSGERQETILSSSRHREWGNRGHFSSHTFDRRIDVELVAGLDWLGVLPPNYKYHDDSGIPDRFVLTSEGWRGLNEKRYEVWGDSPWSYTRHFSEASLPNMDETIFMTQRIGYLSYSGGGHSFEVLELPGVDHNDRSQDRLTINGVEVEQEYGEPYEILSFFSFPDSSAGFIQARWGYEWGYCRPTGLCGCNIKDDLELVRVDSMGGLTAQNLVTVDQCGPNMIVEKDTVDRQLEDDDWIRAGDIIWEEEGRQVVFDFEKVEVVFSWNENGEEVRYALKEKESD